MEQIHVDFEVWKTLTGRRKGPEHSYNQVLRELLGLPDSSADEPDEMLVIPAQGRTLGGRFVPDGTKLRAKHKGEWHHAQIRGGELIGPDGAVYPSASAAARSVTQTNVNGLLFWSVKRPGDGEWGKLIALRRSQ